MLFGFECVFFSSLDAELGVFVVGVSQNLVEIGIFGGNFVCLGSGLMCLGFDLLSVCLRLEFDVLVPGL